MQSFMTFWITSTDGDKLVRPILTKENVIVDNNLTLEISNEEYDKFIDVEDIKVCNNFPEYIMHLDTEIAYQRLL